MRFHEPLNDILGNKVQIKILRLFLRTKSPFTGRELARLIGYSHNQTRLALEELERNGLVIRQRAGRSNLYSLDNENIIVTELLAEGFVLEDTLLNRLADIYFEEVGKNLVSIILFGSIAQAEEKPESDIDLVLVVKDKANLKTLEDRVSDASLIVTRRFGNQASPIVIKKADFEKKTKQKSGLWRDVVDTGIELIPRT